MLPEQRLVEGISAPDSTWRVSLIAPSLTPLVPGSPVGVSNQAQPPPPQRQVPCSPAGTPSIHYVCCVLRCPRAPGGCSHPKPPARPSSGGMVQKANREMQPPCLQSILGPGAGPSPHWACHPIRSPGHRRTPLGPGQAGKEGCVGSGVASDAPASPGGCRTREVGQAAWLLAQQ